MNSIHRLPSGPAFYLLLLFLAVTARAGEPSFLVVPLGVAGGLEEGNLSAYLVGRRGSDRFLCLDAGSLGPGIRAALANGAFDAPVAAADATGLPENAILQRNVRAYLLSHAHLDHLAGLVVHSTDDAPKPIYGLSGVLDQIRDHLFNWAIWPNFGDAGPAPALRQYAYRPLAPGNPEEAADSGIRVAAFPLSHSEPYHSTAFLLEADGEYLLYLGDTGPDAVEGKGRLAELWQRIAPLVREGKLRGLFIEASYPDGRPDKLLFGHLTPQWVTAELHRLAETVNPEAPEKALAGLPTVITHIKPGPDTRHLISRQLSEQNHLGVTFILAEQGRRLEF